MVEVYTVCYGCHSRKRASADSRVAFYPRTVRYAMQRNVIEVGTYFCRYKQYFTSGFFSIEAAINNYVLGKPHVLWHTIAG